MFFWFETHVWAFRCFLCFILSYWEWSWKAIELTTPLFHWFFAFRLVKIINIDWFLLLLFLDEFFFFLYSWNIFSLAFLKFCLLCQKLIIRGRLCVEYHWWQLWKCYHGTFLTLAFFGLCCFICCTVQVDFKLLRAINLIDHGLAYFFNLSLIFPIAISLKWGIHALYRGCSMAELVYVVGSLRNVWLGCWIRLLYLTLIVDIDDYNVDMLLSVFTANIFFQIYQFFFAVNFTFFAFWLIL